MNRPLFLFLFLNIFIMSSCTSFVKDNYPHTDYSMSENWLYVEEDTSMKFDVFFMHPTTYTDTSDGYNMNLHNEQVNKLSIQALDRQATVFQSNCNLYAPKYRQMSMMGLDLTIDEREPYQEKCTDDMFHAFVYWLENYNNGRPYILAGHSQGSNTILNFLLKYPNLVDKSNLVAIYGIGYSFTQQDIDEIGIPLSKSPSQTPALICWNTIGKDGNSPVINEGALCVNPLNWNSDTLLVDNSHNIKARIRMNDGNYSMIENFTSAKIDNKGGLVIPDPPILNELSMIMGDEVYHLYDYDFFYGNILENVQVRCNNWMKER